MTAMSKAAILRGMRESIERRKRHDAAVQGRELAVSARARLDALVAARHARPDPLVVAAERARRLWPFRADIERFESTRRADLVVGIHEPATDFEWSTT